MSKPKLSVVITSYNEKENIQRGVLDEINDYLKKVNYSWEVIINDDGSTDGSRELIKEFVKQHSGFKFIKGNHGGKAAGLLNGIKKAKGEIILFTDVDQSTPLKEVEKLLPYYEQGYDVVFGSRGKVRQNFPWYRQLMSWGFRVIRQIFLLRGVSDTQCGFKSFKAKLIKDIFPQLSILKNTSKATGWTVSAFDVELLFLAEKQGAKLKEVEVFWQDEDISTTKSKNFISESLDMFKQILAVKRNDKQGKYD